MYIYVHTTYYTVSIITIFRRHKNLKQRVENHKKVGYFRSTARFTVAVETLINAAQLCEQEAQLSPSDRAMRGVN